VSLIGSIMAMEILCDWDSFDLTIPLNDPKQDPLACGTPAPLHLAGVPKDDFVTFENAC
jgi:hypothetical protein